MDRAVRAAGVTSGVLLALVCMTAAASERGGEVERTIQVTGAGRTTATPDMAVIHTGVVSERPTAAEALEANSEAMRQVMDVLRRRDIESRDLQTSRFEVSPVYRSEARGRQPEIVGYRASNQVMVRIRQLNVLGEVLDEVVRAGANQVSGVAFTLQDPAAVEDEARRRAIENARHRAGVYAAAAEVGVGRVLRISEQPIDVPRPPMMQRMAMEAAAVPVEPGELEMQMQVTVVFALE